MMVSPKTEILLHYCRESTTSFTMDMDYRRRNASAWLG